MSWCVANSRATDTPFDRLVFNHDDRLHTRKKRKYYSQFHANQVKTKQHLSKLMMQSGSKWTTKRAMEWKWRKAGAKKIAAAAARPSHVENWDKTKSKKETKKQRAHQNNIMWYQFASTNALNEAATFQVDMEHWYAGALIWGSHPQTGNT